MIQKELRELCKRLAENDPTLTTLNLDYGNIGIDGAKALRDALRHNKMVTAIHLHHSNLGFEGTKILFEGLKGRGIQTAVNIVDDYTEDEYDTLLTIAKQPKKERGQFGNNKGMDNKIFANLANDGRGYVAHAKENKTTNKNASKGDKSHRREGKAKASASVNVAEGKQNG